MIRPGLVSKVIVIVAFIVATALGAPSARADLFSVEQLATIGLSDFGELKVFEFCLDYDQLTSGGSNPEIYIDLEINRIDIPDLGIKATKGKWRIGPVKFQDEFDPICISNLDVKLDIADEDGDGELVDASGLEEKLKSVEGVISEEAESKELVKSDIDENEGREAREILDTIRANNGLLPEFTIQFTYTVEQAGKGPLERRTISFVNTNPRPIRVLRPTGSLLRPTLRFEIPNVPPGVAYLENEYWIEDADGNNVWREVARVRYSPAQYGRTVSHPYPSDAPDLRPGGSYTIVSKLRDPYGAEVDPTRLVGVRHNPDGESARYEIAVEPIELVFPYDGTEADPNKPIFVWNDPNSAEIRRAIDRYQLTISGQPPVAVAGAHYEMRTPLLPDWEYTWEVEALDRFGEPIPGTRSESGAFRTLRRDGSGEASGSSGFQEKGGSGDQDIDSSSPAQEKFEALARTVESLEDILKDFDGGSAQITPLTAGYVVEVFSGASVLVGNRELPEGTGLARTGFVPLPIITFGERIVVSGRSSSVAAVIELIESEGYGVVTRQYRLASGTYIAAPECLQTEDGRCLSP